MPCPRSLRGAGPSEVVPALRLPVRRVHLAVRRYSQRPNIDRMALNFKQSSFRHVTRVSPSHSFSVFSPLSALTACSCPLALSGSGKPLTQECPLNPSHLRWGCCMNYCGAPEAIGGRLQAVVRCRPVTVPRLGLAPLSATDRGEHTVTGNGRGERDTVVHQGARSPGHQWTARCLGCLTRRAGWRARLPAAPQ